MISQFPVKIWRKKTCLQGLGEKSKLLTIFWQFLTILDNFWTIETIEAIFDNWKDSPGDLTFETLITILTIENLNSDNHFYLTINFDTGQHSQYLWFCFRFVTVNIHDIMMWNVGSIFGEALLFMCTKYCLIKWDEQQRIPKQRNLWMFKYCFLKRRF